MCIQLVTTYTSCPAGHALVTCTQSCPLPYFALPYHRIKAEYVFAEGFCPICDDSYGPCWRSTSTRARRTSCGAVMEGGGYRDEVQSQEGTTIVADSTAPVWSAAVNGGGAVAVEMHDKATQTEEGRRRNTYKQRKDRAWNQRKAKKRAEEKTAATATADADADADDEKTQRPATKYSEGDKQPSNRAIKKAIREKNKEVRQQQQQQQQTMNGAKREEEGAASGGNASEAAAAAALRGGGNKREGGKKENAKTRRNWAWKARDKERARGKKEALERGEGVK